MSAALETLPPERIPPRHFWRRAFGYAIDVLLALLAFSVILLLLSKLPTGIQPVSFFNSTYCEPAVAGGPMVTRVEALWHLKLGEIRTNQLCRSSRIGPDQRIFVSSVTTKEGASTLTKVITVLVDENGVEIKEAPSGGALLHNLAALIAMAALFAFLVSKSGSTLGKRLFGLKVIDVDSGSVGLFQAVKRELLKALPLLIIAAIQVAAFYLTEQASKSIEEKVSFVQNAAFGPMTNGFLPTAILGLVLMAWWVWPLIFWRGQTLYDRISDCRVVKRSSETPPAAAGAPA